MADEEESELSETQKKEIAKWFLLNSPPGEIQYVAKGLDSPSLSEISPFFASIRDKILIYLLLLYEMRFGLFGCFNGRCEGDFGR